MKMESPKDDLLTSSVFEQTLESPIQIHYNPPDDEVNFWMFAMIGMGCAFVIFVIGSIYLMCKSTAGNDRPEIIRRHPTTKVTRGPERTGTGTGMREHL